MILYIDRLSNPIDSKNGGMHRKMTFLDADRNEYYTYIDSANNNYRDNWDIIEDLVDNLPLYDIVVSIKNFKLKNKAKGLINADCRVTVHKPLTQEANREKLEKLEII